MSVANLGAGSRANFSAPDSSELVLGVVLTEVRGKLLVLRRQPSGGYKPEAESAVFENRFGQRYYVEQVQVSGARRFSIQVNTEAACGIQVEIFRFASVSGVWRVSGYDKSEPDEITCNVNLQSREYSANLLTHKVNVVRYKNGKVVKRESRVTKVSSPDITHFNFSMFEDEP